MHHLCKLENKLFYIVNSSYNKYVYIDWEVPCKIHNTGYLLGKEDKLE